MRLREHFDIPDDVAYLNCAAVGPVSRETRRAGEQGAARKARPWEIPPEEWFSGMPDAAREAFAGLVGGDPDGVAIIPATSYGMGVAAANVAVGAGQRIVLMEGEFPSNVYPWQRLAQARGARVEFVPRPNAGDWTEPMRRAIGPDVAVVSTGSCHWTDGRRVDLVALREATRRVGAALVVDGAQSLGVEPFDVARVQPDFLVGATYKWLLGPYSLGFLYCAPDRRAGQPIESGWITRQDAVTNPAFHYIAEHEPSARRYDVGERSNLALLPMATVAIRQLRDWGVEATRARVRELTAEIEAGAARLGLSAVPAAWRADHMLGLRLPGGIPDDLLAKLQARGVFISHRGDCLRIAPHAFNESRDVARLFDALKAALR